MECWVVRTTPDTVFQNIFKEENKITKQKEAENLLTNSLEIQMKIAEQQKENPEKNYTHFQQQTEESHLYKDIFIVIKRVLDEIKQKNFSILALMVIYFL